MRNIFIIARITLLLNCRKGTFWFVQALIACSAAFVFFISTSDNVLENELHLRIQYSYVLTYSLLTLIVMSVSCFTVRSQIDGKQMHLLTSLPITRKEIWLGKWLGLVVFAFAAELTLLSTISISSLLYCRTYEPGEIESAKKHYLTARYENFPITADDTALTHQYIRDLISKNKLDPAAIDKEAWKEINFQIRKKNRLILPESEKVWTFNLQGKPKYGNDVDLKFRFYSQNRRKRISGIWEISAPGKVESYKEAFEVFPFEYNTIKIPLSQIPESGQFELKLTNQSPSELIVSTRSGLRIYCEDGSVYYNLLKAFCIQLIHLSVTIGVGLTAGVAFTFSVAAFFSIVLYMISVSSGYFTDVATELTQGYGISLLDKFLAFILHTGLWLVKGLRPPEIITRISSAISIPLQELSQSWLPGVIIYGIVIFTLGIYLLTQKELDKIPT